MRQMRTFIRLRREQETDGLGGTRRTWRAGEYFQGCVSKQSGREIAPGGLPALRTRAVLMHGADVVLRQGERVMEAGTGAVWRVCGNSDDMTARRFAGIGCAQVPVERIVGAE